MGSAINLDEIKRFETTEVYTHPEAKVDIVLVHGLNGGPRHTWTGKNGVFWPTELLPVTLKSVKARILVYGYNADVYAFGSNKSPSSDMIYQHAQSLVTNLAMERKSEEASDHPIIFVAHSLGGILVKRALELSNDLTSHHADDNRSIYISTYGLIFLGTPHTGADPAKWGIMLENMVHNLIPKKLMHSDSQLVKTLQSNNETLQNINLHFLDIYQRFRICMAHEELQTDLKGTKGFIVDQASASPMLPDVDYFGIASTHSGMCKFESKNSPGYLNVSTKLKTWIQAAPATIKPRLELERRQREEFKRNQAAELLGIYNTPQASSGTTPAMSNPPSINNSTIIVKSTLSIVPDEDEALSEDAPYFIKPSGFRPNSLFVGREDELAELHRLLFDKKKRDEGTSAVLIQSMPGGGKTHLAREYVYRNRDKFPGGIFWIRAKSQSEIAAGFWDIARKAALKNQPASSPSDPGSQDDPQQFIKMVKKWLNHREEWLMVLDGIYFDDPEGLRRFIPDGINTALIYTSTEKSASGDHHFMNPQLLRLPQLSAREAQILLLKELDKKRPFSTDDLKHSMELVQSMAFLPVVIHAVAQRIKMTGEHLGRVAKSYASEPRLRGLGAYKAVVEQLELLGAFEALNLMNILCFFSQHIPVEMIHLGLPVLDELRIPVRARESNIPCDLNNTFKMLNTFALIDRNEHEMAIQSSQSSKGSAEMLADNIDVIRVHSVVQWFFSDTLRADKDPLKYPIWLQRAVQVFCCSYDMANERITRKTNAGLVEDYRLYEIHGIRLREHVTRHEKKIPMPETHAMLEERLTLIKMEIERRTPESSSFIAGGKPDAFQTSIFDRTSSSSETGPETPGYDLKFMSTRSSWELEPGKDKHESPISMFRDNEFRQPLQDVHIPKNQFPPLPMPEDPGYDSDREGSTTMTVQPSQHTLVQDPRSPISPGWETVKPRRPKVRPGRLESQDHRTTRTLERQRYSDSAGAFRSISAIDPRAINPRLSRDLAEGFLQNASSREQSRGRISGRSNAEVALAQISKNSPPPARGGGMITDRRARSSSLRGSDSGRMMTGISSYASAVSGSTRDTVSGFKEQPRPVVEMVESSNESTSSAGRAQSAARDALQRFPAKAPLSPHTSQASYTPMPPYPQTPSIEYDEPFPSFPLPLNVTRVYSQDRISRGSDQGNLYPRKTGPIPFESQVSGSSSPLKRDLPHDYQAWHSQGYSESLPSSSHQAQNPPFLSLSSPDIRSNEVYIPGHPEFSANDGGYTSQPMSRHASGQSAHSAQSTGALERDRRRPSLAETEPIPQLPIFSPRIGPTSYQVYELLRESERGTQGERDRGMVRKSPRLGFSHVAERLHDWTATTDWEENTLPPPRHPFNPAAPSFSPSSSAFTYSPAFPPAPANSTGTTSSPYPSAPPPSFSLSGTASPYPNQHQQSKMTPSLSQRSARTSPHLNQSFPSPNSNSSSNHSPPAPTQGSADMGRTPSGGSGSGSGGLKVGRRVIEFGDFPEPVDFELARERAERGRERIWREESGRLLERMGSSGGGGGVERARLVRDESLRGLGGMVSVSEDGREGLGIRGVRGSGF